MELSLKKTLIASISVISLGIIATVGHNIYLKKKENEAQEVLSISLPFGNIEIRTKGVK